MATMTRSDPSQEHRIPPVYMAEAQILESSTIAFPYRFGRSWIGNKICWAGAGACYGIAGIARDSLTHCVTILARKLVFGAVILGVCLL